MEERIVPHKRRLAVAFNYAHVQAHVDVFLTLENMEWMIESSSYKVIFRGSVYK